MQHYKCRCRKCGVEYFDTRQSNLCDSCAGREVFSDICGIIKFIGTIIFLVGYGIYKAITGIFNFITGGGKDKNKIEEPAINNDAPTPQRVTLEKTERH